MLAEVWRRRIRIMNIWVWVLVVLYWSALYIGNVWLCFEIAAQKNRNDVLWGWSAVLFGLFATAVIACLPALKTTMENRAAAKALREREEIRKAQELKASHAGIYGPKK